MTETTSLSNETREDLIRRAWYSHDARWYAAVAEEFGFDAANRLNRRIVRAVGQVEAGRLIRALGVGPAAGLPEFLPFMEAGRQLYVAPPLIEMEVRPLDDKSYEIAVTGCFVAQNIQRAGIAESYDCAVFDRVQGWHDALGLPLDGDFPPRPCALAEGRECRCTVTLREERPGESGEPSPG